MYFINRKRRNLSRRLRTDITVGFCLFIGILEPTVISLTPNKAAIAQSGGIAPSTPISLRFGIKVRKIIDTVSASPSLRIVKDSRNNRLYYMKRNGEIYRVNLADSSSQLLYNLAERGLKDTQGLAIGPTGIVYVVGNEDSSDSTRTRATIVKGVPNPTTGIIAWTILARTAYYPKSATAYDHLFNGIVVDPTGNFIYVNSGSRTDHGEVQSANGLFPNTREVGLTACIFRFPANGLNIFLPNNRETLRSLGYVFAEGTRDTFDMAFAPNGDLLGPDNGPDRDMSEELNWLRLGNHYGFPWRIGGEDNPQQFPNYDPAKDLLLDSRSGAVRRGYFRNDPTFLAKPNRVLTEPIPNQGPDANSFRDPTTGRVRDASNLGISLNTFTAHRSPLGLVFDTQGALSPEFNGDGFMLSFTKGDATGNTVFGPFRDSSQDLVHLNLTKVGGNQYQVQAKRLVAGFTNPIDAEIIDNKIYVLEYGATQGIWEVTLPSR